MFFFESTQKIDEDPSDQESSVRIPAKPATAGCAGEVEECRLEPESMEELLKNKVARNYLVDFLQPRSTSAVELVHMWREVEERRLGRSAWYRQQAFRERQPLPTKKHNHLRNKRLSSYLENRKSCIETVNEEWAPPIDASRRPRSEVFNRSSTLNAMYSSQNFKIAKKKCENLSLQKMIEVALHTKFYERFLKSLHYWRYVMEVVSRRRLNLTDVLQTPSFLVSYFAQFLEEEKKGALLNGWLAFEAYKQAYTDVKEEGQEGQEGGGDLMRMDANTLFNRYFSSPRGPLSFHKSIREILRRELMEKTSASSFCTLQSILFQAMEELFVKFLKSDHFYNFITSLVLSGKPR